MPFLDVDGARLHYILSAASERPWLVLSNSLGTDLSMWEKQIAAFESKFNLLRYDSRGHGQSTSDAAFGLADLGRDVVALLDKAGVETAAFCGLSLGGMVGQWLAVHASQRLSAAVLCCTATKIGTVAGWNERIATVQAGGMNGIIPSILERWYTPEFRVKSPADVERTRRMLEGTKEAAYAMTCAAIRDADFTNRINEIQLTTLVVCGVHDPVTPPSDARFLAEKIKGARLLELEAAHLANMEAADTFTAAVLAFLTTGAECAHAG